MMQMLVRNRVKDFALWHSYLQADLPAAAEYGLTLKLIWQAADDPNNVFFLLAVADRARAEAFLSRPESVAIGEKSGVIDGDYHFLETV